MALRKRRPGLVYPTHEDWHYVGAGGEPAFQNSWVNVSGAYPAMAFRLREAGVVDLIGFIDHVTDSTAIITTLPVGYRPSDLTFMIARGVTAASVSTPVSLGIEADGDIGIYGGGAVRYLQFSGSFFIDTAAP